MKKFTKLFLSCALVSVVATAAASMAMAEDIKPAATNGLSGTYADGVITIVKPDDLDETKEATFLVVKGTAYSQDSDVVGIDQATGAAFDKTGLLGAPTADTADANGYTVLLGYYPTEGDFKIAKGTLFGSSAATIPVLIGDVDFANGIIATDATMIARFATGSTSPHGSVGDVYTVADENYSDVTSITIGDVDFANGIIATDATMIARYATGSTSPHGHVGETIEVEAKDAE